MFTNREWKDGVFPAMLRKFCIQSANNMQDSSAKAVMKVILLDGKVGTLEKLVMVVIPVGLLSGPNIIPMKMSTQSVILRNSNPEVEK